MYLHKLSILIMIAILFLDIFVALFGQSMEMNMVIFIIIKSDEHCLIVFTKEVIRI